MDKIKNLVDPELKKYCRNLPFSKFILRATRLPLKILYATVSDKNVDVKSVRMGEGLTADVFTSRVMPENKPTVLFMHVGGFGYDAAPQHKKMAFGLAKNGYTVVLPHYRLLPNNKYPAAKEDALAAYAWTLGNLSDHVAVMGDSAGGTLAAYVALCAEKRGLKPPCCQLLFYPLTDSSMSSESMKKYEKAPLWCAANNRKLLEMYGAAGAAAEAFPLTARLPSVIVSSYIETAEHDCLSDEGAAFSDRLKEAGGETVLVRTKGTMHGYAGAQNSRLLKELQRSRLEFLSKFEK